jgi:hypothetical protein
MSSKTIRIVTVTPAVPYALEADEKILERQSVYGGDLPTWNLLIAKGGVEEHESSHPYGSEHGLRQEARETRREIRDDEMRAAFAAAFLAFGKVLSSPSTS